MTKPVNHRARYESALAKVAKAKNELEAARIAMQLHCKHAVVAEVPWRSDPFGYNHTPSHRICADCGFTEEGWSCGHQILTAEPTVIKAERIGTIWPNARFVVPRSRHSKPRNKTEAYEMAVRGTLPSDYR